MNCSVTVASTIGAGDKKSCIVVPLFEDGATFSAAASDEHIAAVAQRLINDRLFRGKPEEVYFIPTPDAACRGTLLIGMGPQADLTAERVRRAAGAAVCKLRENRIEHVVLDVSMAPVCIAADAFLEGLVLGQYDFTEYKKPDEERPPRVESFNLMISKPAGNETLDQAAEHLRRTALIADATNMARDLGNRASNDLTPTALAEIAADIAREFGCKNETLDEDDMTKLGMNALLGVAKGSAERANLIILRYTHSDDAPTVAIVGKGITFDSGGISIKPAAGMHEMKFDMCGAAAVLGVFKAIAQLKPAINVVALAPAAENMTGSAAQKPGDIVRAFNGKTIEVHNTDAEGRLVLADAVAYAVKTYSPVAIVDLATLTGACVVALGNYAAGLFDNDEALRHELTRAAEASGERVWPLPLWDDYCAMIKGTHADLCNIGPKGEAGAIMGAAFIKEFVEDVPWAHLDIAGTAWGAKKISYQNPDHASGYGVRLLTQWILNRAQAT